MSENDSSTIGTIITLVLFFLPLVVMIYKINQVRRLHKNISDIQVEAEISSAELKEEVSAMHKRFYYERDRVRTLEEKYSPIVNVEGYVREMELKANEVLAAADKRERESQSVYFQAVGEAEQKSSEIKLQAREKLSAAKLESEYILNSSLEESSRIIAIANKKAKNIAGQALEAKGKSLEYEAAIVAMKNTIQGYKDEYIIPNQSVLDGLAEEYNFSDAGKKLKLFRRRVRLMVKNNQAGSCEYVELVRQRYAIHFVVDAFNGKVDTALARVKHDNFGKVKQEIIDAYALVNHNGEPFRNAKIKQEYLDARLEELKWAVITHELKKLEQEEQREIKQRMRDEDRAKREMEKAIKTAQKEEGILQEAMKMVREELANASNEQRQKYEEKLSALEVKLAEAESKEKRALSMAQQTRSGHVYIISNVGSFGEGIYKVGMTRRLEPLDRVKELGDASVPFEFDVHAMIYSKDAPKLEKALHRGLKNEAVNKVNPRKEFFRAGISELKALVEEEGVENIHWTLMAEAAEYRESLAIGLHQQNSSVEA